MTDLVWKTVGRCESSGCVEVAVDGAVVHVRSSRRPDVVATFDLDEWQAFTAETARTSDTEARRAAEKRVLDAVGGLLDVEGRRSSATEDSSIWLEAHAAALVELQAAVDARRALGHTAPAERVAQVQCPFPGSDGESCLGCGQPWPCRAELIEELERQKDDIERAREVMGSDAYRLAVGETCMPGQPAGCGDYHNAGQCVRKSAAPAEGWKADHTPAAKPCESCGGHNPERRGCPCGHVYCGECECDCADWHTVVHDGHDGFYSDCQQPACVELKNRPEDDEPADGSGEGPEARA